MTFEEYQNLYKEWKETDSINRREEIDELFADAASVLLNKLDATYEKYGKNFVDDSDYQPPKGGLRMVRFNEVEVVFRYVDKWAYGGSCDIAITVPMRYLDEEEFMNLENNLRMEYITTLKREFKNNESQIEWLKNENTAIQAKISELEKENDIP